MKLRPRQNFVSNLFFALTPIFCALLIVLIVALASGHSGNDLHSFTEPVLTLSEGWVLTDSQGRSSEISLPKTIAFGSDGEYTLSCELPEVGGLLVSPALRIYSNYVDVSVAIDGKELYSFPESAAEFSGATGNTYHFVRMPADYAGKTLSVKIRCQLGDDVTYLINPALLGSKATMLSKDVMRSLPAFTLAGSMVILALGLSALYFAFRKQLDLNRATLYTALFTLLFAVYIYLETSFAQLLMPNGYLLCYATLMLLALVPIPLLGIFLDAVSLKFRPIMRGLMVMCSVNFIAQTIINFTGAKSVRAMLPATHAVMVLSIITATLCLIFSDAKESPTARRMLLSAVPMIVGGVADIALLALNKPSFNNSFWFVLGVTIFIINQMRDFIRGYFALYKSSLESELLSDMAYHDVLSNIENRNAYERKLKELSGKAPSPRLCCIVMDINDLKLINDALGHQAGDTAIARVGAILSECMPRGASYYRTGGDEFVALLENYDEPRTRALAEKLTSEARRHGELCAIPINLAVGFGQYSEEDGNIIDFIRRVDTHMYECKRRQKKGRSSWLDPEQCEEETLPYTGSFI